MPIEEQKKTKTHIVAKVAENQVGPSRASRTTSENRWTAIANVNAALPTSPALRNHPGKKH
jgi:hypothetical protein